MKDPMSMRGPDAAAQRLYQCIRFAFPEGIRSDALRESFALHVLGDQVHETLAIDFELEQSNDRRMVERLERRPFAPKSSPHVVVGEKVRVENLDRHRPAAERVDRLVNRSDSTVRELRNQLVAAGELRSHIDVLGLGHRCVQTIPHFFPFPLD